MTEVPPGRRTGGIIVMRYYGAGANAGCGLRLIFEACIAYERNGIWKEKVCNNGGKSHMDAEDSDRR